MELQDYIYVKDFYKHKLYIEDMTNELVLLKEYNKSQKEIIVKLMAISKNVNIPNIIEAIEEEKKIYCIEQYIKGITLKEYADIIKMKNDVIEEKFLINFLKSMVNILKEFKSNDLVHRDLKPENIIIDNNDIIYVIDFDISRVYKKTNAKDTKYFGTEGYAAPEQYGYSQTNYKTDIYSLGMIIKFLYSYMEENDKVEQLIQMLISFTPEDRIDCNDILNYLKENFDSENRKNLDKIKNLFKYIELFNVVFFKNYNNIIKWIGTIFFLYFLIGMNVEMLKEYNKFNYVILFIFVILNLVLVNLFNSEFKGSKIYKRVIKYSFFQKELILNFIRICLSLLSFFIIYVIISFI